MSQMQIKNSAFNLPIEVTQDGKIEKTLKTADTFLDKNIVVEVDTPEAELSVSRSSGTDSISMSGNYSDYLTTETTSKPINISLTGNSPGYKISVDTPGFITEADEITTPNVELTDTVKLYAKVGSLSVDMNENVGTQSTVKVTNSQLASSVTIPEGDPKYYLIINHEVTASTDNTGFIDDDTQSMADRQSLYTVQEATLKNAATAEIEYTTKTAPILISGSGLYIDEGYISNTYISLADLVPDEANVKATDNKYIYNTVSAYDKDGNLVAGTMSDATLTLSSSDPTIEGGSITPIATLKNSAGIDLAANVEDPKLEYCAHTIYDTKPSSGKYLELSCQEYDYMPGSISRTVSSTPTEGYITESQAQQTTYNDNVYYDLNTDKKLYLKVYNGETIGDNTKWNLYRWDIWFGVKGHNSYKSVMSYADGLNGSETLESLGVMRNHTFAINGITIGYTVSDTLNQFITTINSHKNQTSVEADIYEGSFRLTSTIPNVYFSVGPLNSTDNQIEDFNEDFIEIFGDITDLNFTNRSALSQNSKISDLSDINAITEGYLTQISFKINDNVFTYDINTNTLEDIKSDINSNTSYEFDYDRDEDMFTLEGARPILEDVTGHFLEVIFGLTDEYKYNG